MNNKLKIAVLLGGTSPEREVSKSTGKGIIGALLNLGYETVPIDPAYGDQQPDFGDWYYNSVQDSFPDDNFITCMNSGLFKEVGLAFIALHGKWGEDGVIQSLLELKGIKYAGSGVLASALSMDKAMSKVMFRHFDVSTPDWFVMNFYVKDNSGIIQKIEKEIKYPCIIKPNDQGSTIGLSIVDNQSEVEVAIKLAFEYSKTVLVEQFIEGREIAVGVVGPDTLPPVEIIPSHRIYDYECKYTAGKSRYDVPAKLSPELTAYLKAEGLKAYNALGCSGYGRVDFRLTSEDIAYCLEVNSLPGMTPTSLLPKMAQCQGQSFEQLVERIIQIALS